MKMFKDVLTGSPNSRSSSDASGPLIGAIAPQQAHKSNVWTARANRLRYAATHAFEHKADAKSIDQFDTKDLSPQMQKVLRRFHNTHCANNPSLAFGLKSYMQTVFATTSRHKP